MENQFFAFNLFIDCLSIKSLLVSVLHPRFAWIPKLIKRSSRRFSFWLIGLLRRYWKLNGCWMRSFFNKFLFLKSESVTWKSSSRAFMKEPYIVKSLFLSIWLDWLVLSRKVLFLSISFFNNDLWADLNWQKVLCERSRSERNWRRTFHFGLNDKIILFL